MKRAYSASKYARPCERYCREHFPDEAEGILRRAEEYYREFMKDMPDLGENMMAKNMLDWFTILSFYEASDRRMDGEVLLDVKRRAVERLRFLGKIVDGNRSRWIYRLFEKTYARFIREQRAHQARGEWMDSWRVEINPDHRQEGFCFLIAECFCGGGCLGCFEVFGGGGHGLDAYARFFAQLIFLDGCHILFGGF